MMVEATGGAAPSSALGMLMQARVAASHGAPDASTNWMRQAMAEIDWTKRKFVMQWRGFNVYLNETLDVGRFYVDKDKQVVAMSEETWDTLNFDTSVLAAVVEDMTRGTSGLRSINMTEPRYSEAVRKRAAAYGSDVVVAKDQITELTQEVNALMMQAKSLNRVLDPSADTQAELFVIRYAKAEHDFTKIAERLAELRDLLDLVGVAVVTA